MSKRIVVCITGSTGSIYGYRLLLATSKIKEVETFAVMTKTGKLVLKQELGLTATEVLTLASHNYDEHDFMAPIASGSFRVDGTVIAPCSMKTLSAVATGYEENLVSRAASVALKEKWPLILLTRESPLSVIHLKNMLSVAEAGGIIMPPLPPLYFETRELNLLVDITVGRILYMLGIKTELHKEWGAKPS
jgi:4-hydroxy-3-polyprenylbenzoate decarboxylase